MFESKLKGGSKKLHVLDKGFVVEFEKRCHELGTGLFGCIAEVIHLNLDKVIIVTDELRGIIVISSVFGLSGSQIVV